MSWTRSQNLEYHETMLSFDDNKINMKSEAKEKIEENPGGCKARYKIKRKYMRRVNKK